MPQSLRHTFPGSRQSSMAAGCSAWRKRTAFVLSWWISHPVVVLLISGLIISGFPPVVQAGDILRGGTAAASGRKASDARANAGAQAAELAKTKAADRLARTTKAINDMRALQSSARAAAGASVPNGLTTGGLKVLTGPNAKWTGASAPVQNGNTVTIKQTESQALLHWETFNVGKQTTLTFNQKAGGDDAGKWIAFNKVFDPSGQPSQILGSIKADGQVYVINQNGIVFGAGSQVNTRTFVASSLPINDNLIEQGLLNQTKGAAPEFLFTALPSGSFDPGTVSLGEGVTVEAGAKITSSLTPEGYGGRVMLVGPKVTNRGTISTPAGQTILAGGLQVGIAAHSTDDASLRGLDVYIGSVTDTGVFSPYRGEVENEGVIQAERGSILMAGRLVRQSGTFISTTSVDVNGRIDLLANYDAVANAAYDPDALDYLKSTPFFSRQTGLAEFGKESVTIVLPEWSSDKTISSVSLPLRSQIHVQGRSIHLAENAFLMAPSGEVTLKAGDWTYPVKNEATAFVYTGGQVYLDRGSLVDVSGSTDVFIPLAHSIMTLQLRGSQLADSPLQRSSDLRAVDLTMDMRKNGSFYGRDWVGTPLGDLTGYLNLIPRNVSQLTMEGGTISIQSGGSVVLREGALLDASGGYARNEAGKIQTTRLRYGSTLVDISDATPDRIYGTIYDGKNTQSSSKWGVSKTFLNSLAPLGGYSQKEYISGANGGEISISAPSMALDGALVGSTVVGPRQLRNSPVSSSMPETGRLELHFEGQDAAKIAAAASLRIPTNYYTSPTPPDIWFQEETDQSSPGEFSTDSDFVPRALPAGRKAKVVLSPALLQNNFGELLVENSDGTITISAGITLEAPIRGMLDLEAANIFVKGDVVAHGGSISLKAYTYSPYQSAFFNFTVDLLPSADPSRGQIVLDVGRKLDASDLVLNDFADETSRPVPPGGGTIALEAYSIDLKKGSSLDVSGGVVVGINGKRAFGDAGSISILSGQDPGLQAILGGNLNLEGDLRGFSKYQGGSLHIKSQFIQIGGESAPDDTLLINPDFFSSHGFATFHLQGIGGKDSITGGYRAALQITPGTIIAPEVLSYRLVKNDTEKRGQASLVPILKPVGERTPASLAFSAVGVIDPHSSLILARGDVLLGEGAKVSVDPLGSVSFSGETVGILGSVFAPGGSITIKGAKEFPLEASTDIALPTVFIGPRAVLSAVGTVLLEPDAFGRRRGSVLDGGQIAVSGNIVAAAGALMDVSGTSDFLDLTPAELGLVDELTVSASSGVNAELYAAQARRTIVSSNGGSITLEGSEMLLSDATLVGKPGGSGAVGGLLSVSSGRFYLPSEAGNTAQINMIVSQAGEFVPATWTASSPGNLFDGLFDAYSLLLSTPGEIAAYKTMVPNGGMGFFSVEKFTLGGFSALDIGGNVRFEGDVSIHADQALLIAGGGVIEVEGNVRLKAPYVRIGREFGQPVSNDNLLPAFTLTNVDEGEPYYFSPTPGTGRLTVEGSLIDVGTTVIEKASTVSLTAMNGDVRGSGTFTMAGDLTITAGQIYPATASFFDIFVYDVNDGTSPGSTKVPGSVTISASGTRPMPLEGGGRLTIMATNILQGGVLRAPLGSISLGWDGLLTQPTNLVTGTSKSTPVTSSLTLASGSTTSVSAVDPLTGLGLLIPFGMSPDGLTWISPTGEDITLVGLPAKSVSLGATSLAMEIGAVVDISGGGDFYSYRWLQGQGGTIDILANEESYAIVSGFAFSYAPYAPFNTNTSLAPKLLGDAGYFNSQLGVGSRVTLKASSALPAGTYTLLPARYALLPGAVLITPTDATSAGTVALHDGSLYVQGQIHNGGIGSESRPVGYSNFEILTSDVVRERAEYADYYANDFLARAASENGQTLQRIPNDAGNLSFLASISVALRGQVLASTAGTGRGSRVDVASGGDFVIGSGLDLDPAVLSSWGVESLLIGGYRDGNAVTVRAENLTLLSGGSPLQAADVTLVAKKKTEISAGASVLSSGQVSEPAAKLELTGDGSLLRVSSDPEAAMLRTGFTGDTGVALVVGDGAYLGGVRAILDSSFDTDLSDSAQIDTPNITLNSGRVSIQLTDPGVFEAGASDGLILGGSVLAGLADVNSARLTSYSSLDFYGTGIFQIGTSSNTEISAGEIRGLNQAGGNVTIRAGSLELDNAQGASSDGVAGLSSGHLVLDLNSLVLGDGDIRISRFLTTSIQTPGGIHATGTGQLLAGGDVSVVTAGFTSESAQSQGLIASGDLRITASGTAPSRESGLGATWALSGRSLDLAADILLPSGTISLTSTAGNITVGGRLDVSGVSQSFFDVTRETGGGKILIGAAGDGSSGIGGGNVLLASSGSLVASSPSNNVAAGTVSITASGRLQVEGSLLSTATSTSGSFLLDAGRIDDFDAINDVLTTGNFFESRTFRARSGDLNLATTVVAKSFTASADAGDITVAGTVNASGSTGGSILLSANGDVSLTGKLSVHAQDFAADGKGGKISLQAGASSGGVAGTGSVTIATGSEIDLRVDTFVPGLMTTPLSSAWNGEFQGTLHIRAPQIGDGTPGNPISVLVNPIQGDILGASAVQIEGYRVFDVSLLGGTLGALTSTTTDDQPLGGVMLVSDVAGSIKANGDLLGANEATIRAAISGGTSFDDVTVYSPGAEIVNPTAPTQSSFSLNAVNSSLQVQSTGGTLLFPTGTPGTIRSSAAGLLTKSDGTEVAFLANAVLSLEPGSKLTFTGTTTATVTLLTGGTTTVVLEGGGIFRTSTSGVSGTVSGVGSQFTLRSASSGLDLIAGSEILFPDGSVNSKIKSTVAGTLTSPSGVVTALPANTLVTIAPGTKLKLPTAGRISYSGSTLVGSTLVSGSVSPVNAVDVTSASGNIALGSASSTYTSDWDLSSFRFGTNLAPGILTMRAAGNIVFYNSLSDGFDPVTPVLGNTSQNAESYTNDNGTPGDRSDDFPVYYNGNNSLWLATPTAARSSLPTNLQSWSYQIISGADLISANPLSTGNSEANVVVGKVKKATDTTVSDSAANNAYTWKIIQNQNMFQVVRTGTGDISIAASGDIRFVNPMASVYTAGTAISTPENLYGLGDFSLPSLKPLQSPQSYNDKIGVRQQASGAYYTMAGGDLSLLAGRDLRRLIDSAGILVDDSSRQMPSNWLYRRGYVDTSTSPTVYGTAGVDTGSAESSITDPSASTSWWVDFSNFFQTAGALGGGDVVLRAGRDLINVDAMVPTNARAASGTPGAQPLVELGGGLLTVAAGRDISGGTFYVEKGGATVTAGRDITTNKARSPSLGTIGTVASTAYLNEYTYLPTTYFLGRASLEISAGGNILMGTVNNPFLMPIGLGNGYWYKSYFSTYGDETSVDVLSLGGDITVRTEASSGSVSQNILELWYGKQLLLSASNAAKTQPWLRLGETTTSPFSDAMSVLPPNFSLTALAGSVTMAGTVNLFPSAMGNLEIIADDAITGMAPVGYNSTKKQTLWRSASLNLSDANPSALPGILSPYAYQKDFGRLKSDTIATDSGFLGQVIGVFFGESGSYLGPDASTSLQQARHAPGILHKQDAQPLRLYSGATLSGLTLYSPKPAQVFASDDITDIAFYIQNTEEDSVSIISAGGDIVAYNAASAVRKAASTGANLLLDPTDATDEVNINPITGTVERVTSNVLAGDVQISGPGSLQILAGGKLDLGTGAGYLFGTGAGITSIGNARNPYLPFDGADLYIGAGIGPSAGLSASTLQISEFLEEYFDRYADELEIDTDSTSLSPEEEAQTAIRILPLILRDAGISYVESGDPADYEPGYAAIETLFGTTSASQNGDIDTRTREIRTKSSGEIQMFLPTGRLILAQEVERSARPTLASFSGTDALVQVSTSSGTTAPPGIVTEYGGGISIFANGNVDIGQARIFTLRGGDIVIWSSTGDIAAGAASKTVATAPPTRVLIDTISATVETDLSGLATGGGIGVLSTVDGVEPGDVNLIAPVGTVDAGDAGIRASGNLSIAAVSVLNADNISVSGTSTGVPSAPTVAAPNVSGLTSGSSSTAAASSAANSVSSQATQQSQETIETPSIISVEVLGYGGGDTDEG